MDLVILLVALLFAATAVGHACFNSFYTKKRFAKLKWLHAHYAVTGLFGLCVLFLLWRTPPAAYTDLILSACFVAVIHFIRVGIDYLDARERKEKVGLIRALADAAANLATIWFILLVLAEDRKILLFLAAFLASMMVFKELKYRTYDDIFLRRKHPRTSAQGGPGPATSPPISVWQAIGRFFKSYFYVIVGFALFYLCLGKMDVQIARVVTPPGTVNPFLEGIRYTLSSLLPMWPPGSPIANVVTQLVEFGVNGLMIIWIGATILQTANQER